MKKIKVYIAGKVTGEPVAECTMKFGTAQKEIEALGLEAVNPLEVVGDFNVSWEEAMGKCIKALIDCDVILFLPDYKDSPGALAEERIAVRSRIVCFYNIKHLSHFQPCPGT